MTQIAYRTADERTLRQFYGRLPETTTRSVVITMDGHPAGIVGVSFEYGVAMLFSDISEELRPHLRSMPVLRAVRRGIDFAKGAGLPVIAFAEAETGAKILEREGFTPDDEPGWYRWAPY